ncbi:hypothetical protein AVEN_217136-1 [Araneus ventricosus]|uniref:DUF4817 domain-containing protein n=1 Tax=Araneus ventricosus TaxID=182803 RepID=A0A4Y2E5Z3_ARAVE|nr:hypothetical protein AVEN_217136-1 [Araneus ventricosus]
MATAQQKARVWFHENKSIVTVQRCFRLEYRSCQSPSKNSIKNWYEKFKGTGNVNHRKGARQPPVSDKLVERVRKTIAQTFNRVLTWRPKISILKPKTSFVEPDTCLLLHGSHFDTCFANLRLQQIYYAVTAR